MDDNKKILLGEKDIISRDNEDLFINLNLNQTFSEIRNDKYENVFDVAKQYNKERNSSRDFRIYGTIDSTVADMDNIVLSAFTASYSGVGINSGTTFLSGFVTSCTSSELVYNGFNPYGMKRGKYILELSAYSFDKIYIQIASNNLTYNNQFYSQQLVFRDADGKFVDYGTKTIDITESGDAIEIDNDFYFLYNKHWIKKDLLIIEEKPSTISFSGTPAINVINEIPIATFFGGSPGIDPYLSPFSIMLNKPSPFGLEQTTLSVLTSTVDPVTELGLVSSSGTLLTLPHVMTFSPGEQVKTFYMFSPFDYQQEFLEDVVLELKDFVYVNTGLTLNHTIDVLDADDRNRVTLSLQNIFANRDYFTGIVREYYPGGPNYSYPMPAVLRNGLKFEGTPMEFYPIDRFNLTIKNVGINTILPVNTSLGVFSEEIFPAGASRSFVVEQNYENLEKHSIKLYFANKTLPSYVVGTPTSTSGFTINGVPIVDYWTGNNYKFDYDTILSCLKKQPSAAGANISGWYRYNLDVPFDVVEDSANLTITLTAKNPGIRLDLAKYKNTIRPQLFENTSVPGTLTAETIQEFVYSAQTPCEFILGANGTNNTTAQYEFTIQKNGFDTMTFTSSQLNATLAAPKYYLISAFHDILRNWNNTTNQPVYIHSKVTSGWANTYSSGAYTSGEVYINGSALLANTYFDYTQNTATYTIDGGSLNESHFGNGLGTYKADFFPTPIATIPSTSEYYSPQDRKQVGYLASSVYSGPVPSGSHTTRKFDFRVGTNPITTFSYNNVSDNGLNLWNSSGVVLVASGYINAPYAPLKTYLETGSSSIANTPQGIIGASPISSSEYTFVLDSYPVAHSFYDLIKLESGTAGIPYEITNIIDMTNSAGNLLTSNGTIHYYPQTPNETFGITINEANNWMGGYSLTSP